MVAEDNSIWFNSHENIAIKEMREKKKKIKQEHNM
jgi:replicative DNA helicase